MKAPARLIGSTFATSARRWLSLVGATNPHRAAAAPDAYEAVQRAAAHQGVDLDGPEGAAWIAALAADNVTTNPPLHPDPVCTCSPCAQHRAVTALAAAVTPAADPEHLARITDELHARRDPHAQREARDAVRAAERAAATKARARAATRTATSNEGPARP